jgi:hypothetical protein
MRTREVSGRVLGSIWPVKPPDVLIVLAFAVVSSIVGSGFEPSWAGRWAWWWAGVAAGLFVVLVLAVRRVGAHHRM